LTVYACILVIRNSRSGPVMQLTVPQTWPVVQVHTGTWLHDLKQARALPENKVTLCIHPLDSHRLAFALDAEKRLLPIVHDVIADACGYRTGQVRPANLL
jgi:hypothetical protein